MASFEDHAALASLDSAYWEAADLRTDTGPEMLFAESGTLQLGSVELQGRAAIAGFFLNRNTSNRGSGRHTRHAPAGLNIQFSGSDRAVMRSLVLVFAGTGTIPLVSAVPATIADVDDICVRNTDGTWLFERRVVQPIFLGPAAASFARQNFTHS